MSFRNHVGILSFDEIFFQRNLMWNIGYSCHWFTSITIIGFDPSVVEVRDLAIE